MKMGARGVQIYTNVAGRPLDDPEFEPFWKAMNKSGTPMGLHPARTASFPDHQSEAKSKYEISRTLWLVLGDQPPRCRDWSKKKPWSATRS